MCYQKLVNCTVLEVDSGFYNWLQAKKAQIFVCQRQLYFPSMVNVINGHG